MGVSAAAAGIGRRDPSDSPFGVHRSRLSGCSADLSADAMVGARTAFSLAQPILDISTTASGRGRVVMRSE